MWSYWTVLLCGDILDCIIVWGVTELYYCVGNYWTVLLCGELLDCIIVWEVTVLYYCVGSYWPVTGSNKGVNPSCGWGVTGDESQHTTAVGHIGGDYLLIWHIMEITNHHKLNFHSAGS